MIYDIFQPGLIRGSNKMPFDPTKAYFYVEHPKEGWRVYLRSACFVHERPADDKPLDIKRFLVVKKRGAALGEKAWEPPKGQMEGKDGLRHPKSILSLLKENVKREVAEEARVKQLLHLNYTGVVFQGREDDYPPNTYFQYHVFSGYAAPVQIERAFHEFAWIETHREEFMKLRSDQREKDAIDWYDGDKKMMGRWSPTLVKMYLDWSTSGYLD